VGKQTEKELSAATKHRRWYTVLSCHFHFSMAWHGTSSGYGWRRQPPDIWRVATNILNKQLWTDDEGWSFSLG